jgi:ligand-binding SRPBCC domain-containing protein
MSKNTASSAGLYRESREHRPPTDATVAIQPVGGAYQLTAGMTLKRPIDEVFDFFADARNLDLITPGWLRFRILTPMPVRMRPGLLLDYRLTLHGVPIRWQSEIAVWDPPHRFVDVQRKGPYRRWEHEHLFQETASGAAVVDRVNYAMFGGRLIHTLFVERDLRLIFSYRQGKLAEILRPA